MTHCPWCKSPARWTGDTGPGSFTCGSQAWIGGVGVIGVRPEGVQSSKCREMQEDYWRRSQMTVKGAK